MSEFTIAELREAEVVPNQGGANAYLCRFGEGDYRMVNRTPKYRLLLETDLLEQAEGGSTNTVDDQYVTFTADVDNDRYHLTVDGQRLNIPTDYEDSVLEAYADGDWEELVEIHEEIVANRVRVGLMDRFMPRFEEARDDGRLSKGEEGWIIDDTFIVNWEAENYLTEAVDTHVVKGGDTVRADEEQPARELRFDIPDQVNVADPSGNDVELSQREARFLASVEALLNPQDYLREEDADYVERAVENVKDPIASLARTAEVTGFTDEKSGLYHGHGLQKHTLDMLGVTDAAVERLFYNSHDHAGVHEMWARRDEFRDAPYSVFSDSANDDSDKWEKIRSTSGNAPIPSSVRQDINERFQ